MSTAPAPDAQAPVFSGILEFPSLASLQNNSHPPPPSEAPVVSVNVLDAQVPVATGEPSVGDVVMALEGDPVLEKFCQYADDAKTESDFSDLESSNGGAAGAQNGARAMEVDESVLETPPHLVPVLEIQFQIQAIGIGNYKPLLPDSIIHHYGQDITILPGNEGCMALGPAYFGWTVGRLLPSTTVEFIDNKVPDEACVLQKHVRGIRPRVGALANPREGEPTEYVLVLADIIKANDKDNVLKDTYRLTLHNYEMGKLDKYKSACLCNVEYQNFQSNEQVHVLKLCVMMGDTTLH